MSTVDGHDGETGEMANRAALVRNLEGCADRSGAACVTDFSVIVLGGRLLGGGSGSAGPTATRSGLVMAPLQPHRWRR